MSKIKNLDWQSYIALFIFAFFTIWWLYINSLSPDANRSLRDNYTVTYGILAVWGGVWGIVASRKWGFFSSVVGRAILVFSIGLLAQEFGQLAYTYYIYYLGIEVPYPSIGDIGYFGSIPLYAYGTYLLAKASGVKISLGNAVSKLQALLIPIFMLSFSYYFFLKDYQIDLSDPLKVFLDFGYPLGQAFYVSLALLTLLLTRGVLGGIMRSKVLFILFALIVQYISDYFFLYQSSRGTWEVGQGNDFMYTASYLLMTLALLRLKVINTE